MSCSTNAVKGMMATVTGGVSRAAGTAAYVAGAAVDKRRLQVAGATTAGGVAGGLLFGNPVGVIAGVMVGRNLGRKYVAGQVQREADERAWQESETGQTAAARKDEALAQTTDQFDEIVAELDKKARQNQARYDTLKEGGQAAWPAKQVHAATLAQAVTKGVAETALDAIINPPDTGRIPPGQRRIPPLSPEVQLRTIVRVGQGMKAYPQNTAKMREQLWLNSAEGKAATRRYQETAKQIKFGRSRATQAYNLSLFAIENDYKQSRADFMTSRRAPKESKA